MGWQCLLYILELCWHPANPARTLARAVHGRISQKINCRILDLPDPVAKSCSSLVSVLRWVLLVCQADESKLLYFTLNDCVLFVTSIK